MTEAEFEQITREVFASVFATPLPKKTADPKTRTDFNPLAALPGIANTVDDGESGA